MSCPNRVLKRYRKVVQSRCPATLVSARELRRYVDGHRLSEGKEDQMVNRGAGKFMVSKRAAAVALEGEREVVGLYGRTDVSLPYRDRNPRFLALV